MSSKTDDGFTVVTSKRRGNRPNTKKNHVQKSYVDEQMSDSDVDSPQVIQKLLAHKSDLLGDSFIAVVRGGLKRIKDHFGGEKVNVIAYGIGNFASCLIAQYQLSLLLILRNELQTEGDCEVYDPIFSKKEKDILGELGFKVITVNEEGKRSVERATVFYMPHCGKALYNNLLWANCAPHRLRNLVIIGNSFSTIMDSVPSRILEKETAFILKLWPYMEEHPLENSFRYNDIFNNTSLHLFNWEKLSAAASSLWLQHDEPVYSSEHLEIILATQNKLNIE